jgi:phosphopantetheinyl transferase
MNEIEKVSNERVKREKYFVWKLLCYGLKHSFDLDEQNLNFLKSEEGAWKLNGVEFSISHSENALAVVISQAPIGIDVERVHSPRSNRMAEYMMNEQELEKFNLVPTEEREAHLIEIWTAKEAIFKSQSMKNFVPKQIDTLSRSTQKLNFQIDGEEYICTVAQPTPEPINVFCDVEFLGVDYMFANVLYFDILN